MEDKYSRSDATKIIHDYITEINQGNPTSFAADDKEILDKLDYTGEFGFSEEIEFDKIEEYIDNCISEIQNNYIKLRALFLKLYKLRVSSKYSMDKEAIDRLIQLIYDYSSLNRTLITKAERDAEMIVSKRGK